MNRQTKNAVLIICEGQKTEPLYFEGLRNELIAKDIWQGELVVSIAPEPPIEDDTEIETDDQYKNRTGRKKRVTRAIGNKALPSLMLKGNSPLQLVEKGLEELQTYDRVFVVYDKDNNTKHKEALEAAEKVIEDKKVDIIYSSRSF